MKLLEIHKKGARFSKPIFLSIRFKKPIKNDWEHLWP